ncbi:polyprenyl synthetase family protein [Eubacterium pyruvativorans]|uniref:polyprenyl synthetase family protein n=1 Tax=Eubacterium pyruvativorans TaxID=155865 RepID=UPI003F8C05F2
MRTFEEYLALTEQHLTDPMPAIGAYAETLEESMKYSLLSGGKRIRPVMLLAAAEMAGGTAEEALPYASAIEFIHTYSLIHDDLPAMDDDALRRGRPTNHMVYGAGMATLAGDGLLSAAFEIMLGDMIAHQQDPEALRRRVRAADAIARGAGVRGMVAGQTADLASESERPSAPLLTFIHENKTAAMIVGAIRAGLFLGDAEEALQNDMERYAYDLGMAFQVADDILDVVGDEKTLGKSVGQDAQNDKLTWVSMYGMEASRSRLHELTEDAVSALEKWGCSGDFFRILVRKLEKRTK